MRWLAAIVALIAIALAPRVARAQVDVRVQSDGDTIGLGDVVHVTMQATSSGSMPIDPQIGATGGFVVVAISPSTSTSMTIANGVMSSQRILTTTWTLRATKVGISVLGPPTVSVDGKRYKGSAVHVRVVPASQAPPRPTQRNPASPFNFDPFNGLLQQFGQMPGFDVQPQAPPPEPQIATDPRLALDSARASSAFLHAVADKTSAVVGEQVTFSVYLYLDPQAITRDPDLTDPHESPADGFVRRALDDDANKNPKVVGAMVGGRPWLAQLLRKSALFPIATGDLAIGEMRVQVGMPGGGVRSSEDLRVHVTEPPIAGRPPGYAIGDVGQLSLAAEVTGRDVEQEGAIGVNVTVSGTGNVPAKIATPEQRGVEWLDPQVGEKLGPQSGDRWGGSRTFQYVVRMHKSGAVDLGEIALPFWDPQTKAYAMARAPLGVVQVKPGAAAASQPEAPPDPLPGLPALRKTMAPPPAPRTHLADAPAFWLGLGGMPLAYAVAIAASSTVKRARERRAARGTSPREEMKARVAAADAASADGDPRAIDAATARAIEAAFVAARGIKLRALATSDVARTLEAAGVEGDVAREVEQILRACEEARFSAQSESPSAARERWKRARTVLDPIAGRA